MEETWNLITSINPVFYAISPISMLFRGIHCLPIVLKTKPKNINEFNKYAEKSLPCDVTFHNDDFSAFQFIQYTFTNREFMDTIPDKLNLWSQKHFDRDANIEIMNGCAADFTMDIVNIKPSQRVGHNPHLFALFPETNEMIGLSDHYYSDGITLIDLFNYLFPEITVKLPFPKYKYYPFISDAFACECVTRNLYDFYKNPAFVTPYETTRLLNRVTYKTDSLYWNRWSNYASNILPVFEYTKGLEYARVALTVGIDTDKDFGNNRIGVIIVLIYKPPKHLSYKSKMKFLMKQFEEKVTQNYKDCITTYDTLRSYDTTILRKFGTTTGIDIVFTSFFLPKQIKEIQFSLGAFIGNNHDYPYFYINSMTIDTENHTTITTNWTKFNHKKYIDEFDAKLIYTFD
jgi:hypothetical protein